MEQPQHQRKIKLLWDFRGPDAERIAEHHAVHLKEYIKNHNLELDICGIEKPSEKHTVAFMVIKESELETTRKALKPHRGQVYEEKN